MRVSRIVGEALRSARLVPRSRTSTARVDRTLTRGRARSRLSPALSAPVLRRPAPAHRHRPRAGGRARTPGLRRAGLGARRLDPGAGHQPASWSCASEHGLTYLFISHDLAGRRASLTHRRRRCSYLGRIVEKGRRKEQIYASAAPPLHRRLLLSAAPVPGPERPRTRARPPQGRHAEPDQPATRAASSARCPHVIGACASAIPDIGGRPRPQRRLHQAEGTRRHGGLSPPRRFALGTCRRA